MIPVSDSITLVDDEISESFIRTSGPGGQHVNKTSTGVQLRFDVARSPSLPESVRARLLRMSGSRLTDEGILIITATRFRSQKANREDAVARLCAILQNAEKVPKRRKKTRPTRASKTRRLDTKRQRGTIKKARGPVRDSGE